jgi:hypothetical protein
VTNADTGPHFKWTFIADIPNPVGDDFSLWACSLCGAVVPGTHEFVHLRLHRDQIPEWLAKRADEAVASARRRNESPSAQ